MPGAFGSNIPAPRLRATRPMSPPEATPNPSDARARVRLAL